ncbi:DnaJ family domain-containing protein [Okibacterium endophyticum]
MAIALIADMQIRKAIERGEFDNLPGSGKPLDLPDHHDSDWWIKSLMKRERIMMLPPSIQLRKDDAALDEQLDQLSNETAVRREIEQFNKRVILARYQLPAGPPLITMPRDIEDTVAAWAERRTARAEEARKKAEEEAQARKEAKMNDRNRRRLFRKRTRRSTRHDPET